MSDQKVARVGFGVMILNPRGEVLLGKRHDDPQKASSDLHGEGSWTMPGGKLDFGEVLNEGAIREVVEETGIKIEKKGLKLITLCNNIVPDAHYLTVGFIYKNCNHEPQVLEPDEITEWRWFDLSDLPSPMYFPSQRVIDNYKEGVVYKPE